MGGRNVPKIVPRKLRRRIYKKVALERRALVAKAEKIVSIEDAKRFVELMARKDKSSRTEAERIRISLAFKYLGIEVEPGLVNKIATNLEETRIREAQLAAYNKDLEADPREAELCTEFVQNVRSKVGIMTFLQAVTFVDKAIKLKERRARK